MSGGHLEVRARQQRVHGVAELVEQGLHLVVGQQRATKVANQRQQRRLVTAVRERAAGPQRVHRRVVVLA